MSTQNAFLTILQISFSVIEDNMFEYKILFNDVMTVFLIKYLFFLQLSR